MHTAAIGRKTEWQLNSGRCQQKQSMTNDMACSSSITQRGDIYDIQAALHDNFIAYIKKLKRNFLRWRENTQMRNTTVSTWVNALAVVKTPDSPEIHFILGFMNKRIQYNYCSSQLQFLFQLRNDKNIIKFNKCSK